MDDSLSSIQQNDSFYMDYTEIIDKSDYADLYDNKMTAAEHLTVCDEQFPVEQLFYYDMPCRPDDVASVLPLKSWEIGWNIISYKTVQTTTLWFYGLGSVLIFHGSTLDIAIQLFGPDMPPRTVGQSCPNKDRKFFCHLTGCSGYALHTGTPWSGL